MRVVRSNLLGIFLLMLFMSSCRSIDANYIYPTGKQQRVLELCALVFTEPHYQHISPSRKVKLNRLRTTSWGFWATFADGRTYKVPIVSGLPEGENTTAITNLYLLHAHHGMTGMKDVIGTILIIPTVFSKIIPIIFHS